MSVIFNNIETVRDRLELVDDKKSVQVLNKTLKELNKLNTPLTDSLVIDKLREIVENTKSSDEKNLIQSFLPNSLSEEDIVLVVSSNKFKSEKEFLSFMDERYPSLFDRSLASSVYKNRK